MSIDVSRFRMPEGRPVDLKKWPTRVKQFYDSKEHYRLLLDWMLAGEHGGLIPLDFGDAATGAGQSPVGAAIS